jgi:hypothetical protein
MRGERERRSRNCMGARYAETNSALYLSIHLFLWSMKLSITAAAFAVGLAAAPAAFAEPVKLSDAQLDQVVGGQGLIEVSISNTGNPNVTVNPNVSANAPVTVSISVLGTGAP